MMLPMLQAGEYLAPPGTMAPRLIGDGHRWCIGHTILETQTDFFTAFSAGRRYTGRSHDVLCGDKLLSIFQKLLVKTSLQPAKLAPRVSRPTTRLLMTLGKGS
jgi:hypothetical protein